MADAPPFKKLGCQDELAPTTFVSSHDQWTRYTVWMRPPGRPIPQGVGPHNRGEMTDSLVALELVNRLVGTGPYSDPAVRLFYGLGRSTNPADYTVTYDADHKASVSGPVVKLFPNYAGDLPNQPMLDLLQPRCHPDYDYRSFPPGASVRVPRGTHRGGTAAGSPS